MRLWAILGLAAGVLVGLLVAASQGWLGPLVACGAEAAPVCVAWPAVVSATVWVLFLAFCVGLAAWQVTEWRRDPAPAAEAQEPARPAAASRARASASRSSGTNTSARAGRDGSSDA